MFYINFNYLLSTLEMTLSAFTMHYRNKLIVIVIVVEEVAVVLKVFIVLESILEVVVEALEIGV